MADKKVVLSLRNISKQYPGVQALDNVSIDFMEGEVHCLVGENGAGKSTFIKMISGADQPDSGVISFEGKEYNAMTPKLSKDLGIEVVYQEFNLAEDLTVAENMYLGEQHADSKLFNLKKLKKRADEVFKKMNIEIDTGEIVKYLTVSYMQFVEIGKALAKDIKVLILDEPTRGVDVGAKAEIYGGKLHGAEVEAQELRGGAALVLAGLAAKGVTTVKNIEYIERGYEDICRDLSQLGAVMERK